MSSRRLRKYWSKLTKQSPEALPRLIISKEIIGFIEATAAGSTQVETSGILIGFHHGKNIRVTRATDAGPEARRSQCGFLRDTSYCQLELNKEFSLSGADYVGEWHTHVIDLPRPSSGDLRTLSQIVSDPDYSFSSFAMILVVTRDQKTQLLAYMIFPTEAHGSVRRPIRVEQVTLSVE